MFLYALSKEYVTCLPHPYYKRHRLLCKHLPHVAELQYSGVEGVRLTEGSTVLKQKQHWNNSLEN